MKNLILVVLIITVTSSCGQHGHDHGHLSEETIDLSYSESDTLTTFPTVGFKKVHQETIPFPVEKVFPLFEPEGRPLLYNKWQPTILRNGQEGSLKGHVEFSKYDNLDVMLTVTKHNPQKGHIQYLVIWDDFEIQRIDIFCKEGKQENTTTMTWVEYNAGLYEKGVPLVSMFVEEGYLVKVVQRYVNNIIDRLESEK